MRRLFEREEWRRLWPRAAAVLVMWVSVWVVASLRELNPDPLRLLLVVALIGAVAWLLIDGVVDPAPGWRMGRPDPHDWLGHDPRTGQFVQTLDDHLTGRSKDRVLRDQLAELAAGVARARHGAETGLLDPGLAATLNLPGRRLGLAEVEDVIERLERL